MRHWIPPVPLAAGIAFQAVGWVLALAYAFAPSSSLALAWVHAVALGWLTLTALSVLLHVVPAFTDLPWHGERVARAAVAGVLAGAIALVVAFVLAATFERSGRSALSAAIAVSAIVMLRAAAVVLVVAILAYVGAALVTLAQPAQDGTSAAIARSLSVTLLMLALTVVLGGVLALALAGAGGRVLALAPSHALLGIGAWLTVLIAGVSAQTFRPMLGARSRWARAHIVSGGALALGPVLGAIGAPLSLALLRSGVTVAALGALVYAADALDIVRRATTPHPPVRAFVVASITWLLVAVACVLAAAYGVPGAWGSLVAATAVVAALAGWAGQMVNAHLHHLGVRVLITLVRGDDDETRPWEILDARLTWMTFVLAQLAVLGVTAGLAFSQSLAIEVGASAGLLAIAAMIANVLRVRQALSKNEISLL